MSQPPEIIKALPWAFSDGAAQGTPSKGGAGGIIHISENHSYSSIGLGEASNNFNELISLYLLILLALEKNIRQLNIYGDSMFAIEVMKGTHILRSYNLFPVFEEIKDTVDFSHITFTHVYRNHNKEPDQLSKTGLDLDKGFWKVKEKGLDGSTEFLHLPWFIL